MQLRRTALWVAAPAAALTFLSPVGAGGGATAATTAAAAPGSITGVTRTVSSTGTTGFASSPSGAVGRPTSNELSPVQREEGDPADGRSSAKRMRLGVNRSVLPDGTAVATRRAAAAASTVTASKVGRPGPELVQSVQGLDHFDTRTADGGNQFSNEPPDQGLCVGSSKVVESVNTAIRVRNGNGTPRGVMSLNKFYGLPSAFIRPDGPFGPNLFDPTCVFDPETRTFFHVADDLETDPETGDLTGRAFLDIAVTQHPLGAWKIYRINVTDDGADGTPSHEGCPCFGDYPHVGFDAYGFYISTNEFPLFDDGFDGAQVYAFSKAELAAGLDDVHVTQFDTSGADRGHGGFTVWPAQSPSAADFDRSGGGTAYFLSSNAVFGDAGTSTHLVTWSLTGTSTLGSDAPTAVGRFARIQVPRYSVPPPVTQRPGPAPLLECLNDPTCRPNVADPGPKETLGPLDSNDSRMQQVVLAHGHLYGSLGTAVTVGGKDHAGVAWYVLNPSTGQASLRATGQLGVTGNDLTYPAIGVTSAGRGVMAFTLAGPTIYPSAAYSLIDEDGVGQVRVAAAGAGPQDGFSEYHAFPPFRPRWGDYGAASATGSNVWIASEYIGQRCTLRQYEAAPFGTCNDTRTALANWGTRISQLRP